MRIPLIILWGLVPLSSNATTPICEEGFGTEYLGEPAYQLTRDEAEWSYVVVSIPVIKEIPGVTEISVGTAVLMKGHEDSPVTGTNIKTVISDSKIEFGFGGDSALVEKVFYSLRIYTESCTINARGEHSLR